MIFDLWSGCLGSGWKQELGCGFQTIVQYQDPGTLLDGLKLIADETGHIHRLLQMEVRMPILESNRAGLIHEYTWQVQAAVDDEERRHL